MNHWTRITQRTACSRAAILGSGRRFCLFEFNYRMWDIALRKGTLDRNAGRNVKRSADVSGNARHFCDGELDFTRMWARARLGRKTEAKTTKPTRNAGRFFIRKSNKFSPLKWKIYFAVQNCLWYIISIIQPILKENNHDWKTQY